MSAQTRTEIAALLTSHGISPNHRLGQHFLADANITRKIVATADLSPGDEVVEVGAGTGTLTRALAETGANVIAYETDERLRPLLEEVTSGLTVELRFQDVTRVDIAAELAEGSWTMVANLPYNVGTPLVLQALREAMTIERFVVMIQREVANRFTATAQSPSYGLPSVVAGLYSEARIAFTVPPQVFFPPPRVDSAVVVLERKPAAPGAERAVELARAGFGQRRKMLRRSLATVLEDPVTRIQAAGMDPTLRAEDLTPEDYLRLAAA